MTMMFSYFLVTTLLLGLAATAVMMWRRLERRSEAAAVATLRDLQGMGEVVAASRYPKIDTDRCIGSGACAKACPEKNVIAVVKGVGVLANPLACVGHGLCMDACPVDAITLVYGTPSIPVQLPQIDQHQETNVDGVFICGEASGMGLIRNAISQGRTAGDRIVASGRRGVGDAVDALVVGAGPAGICATLALMEAGLSVRLLDREVLGGSILHYPRAKLVMTGNLDFPLFGKVRRATMLKEELLNLWREIDEKVNLPFHSGELVDEVVREPDGMLAVHSTSGWVRTANVVLALGRRGSPRKLEVPGEESSKVAYQLLEPSEFAGKDTLVVGGGNSAVECAIALAEEGNCASVSISYRRGEFARCRGENRERIAALIAAGRVRPLFKTDVVSISPDAVVLRHAQTGEALQLPNDAVIVQVGGTPPSDLLGRFGVDLVEKRGDE